MREVWIKLPASDPEKVKVLEIAEGIYKVERGATAPARYKTIKIHPCYLLTTNQPGDSIPTVWTEIFENQDTVKLEISMREAGCVKFLFRQCYERENSFAELIRNEIFDQIRLLSGTTFDKWRRAGKPTKAVSTEKYWQTKCEKWWAGPDGRCLLGVTEKGDHESLQHQKREKSPTRVLDTC